MADLQTAATVQVVLEGVPLPASKSELVSYARQWDPAAAQLLERLPDRQYARLDDVGEELAPTSVRRETPEQLPRPESGKPPGGPDYLAPQPTSGGVRPSSPAANPPKQALQTQTKTQKRQIHVQEGEERQKAQQKAEKEAS
jgi:hypothetical protein